MQMNKMTEKEIFDYVFFAKEIDDNPAKYAGEIEFYRELKSSLDEKLKPEVKNKLMEKISLYRPVSKIVLLPFEEPTPKGAPTVERLAADSDVKKDEVSTRTFIDKDKNIIIRQVTTSGKSSLFVFSVENQELKNFRLVIHPPKTEIDCGDNLAPIAVAPDMPIEKIEVELE